MTGEDPDDVADADEAADHDPADQWVSDSDREQARDALQAPSKEIQPTRGRTRVDRQEDDHERSRDEQHSPVEGRPVNQELSRGRMDAPVNDRLQAPSTEIQPSRGSHAGHPQGEACSREQESDAGRADQREPEQEDDDDDDEDADQC